MRIKFLKDHVNNNAGDIEDVKDAAGSYLIRVGVAEEVIETFTLIEKEEIEPKKEKKETVGLPTAKRKKK